jgi:hypothetical protein
MLPEDARRAFAARVANWIGDNSEDVCKVALKLLDAGFAEPEILAMIHDVYCAGMRWAYGDQ